jgi:phosphoserine phosphatase RsbX
VSVGEGERARVAIGICVRALPGETESGDAGAEFRTARGSVLAMADGLGHGPRAALAANAFLECVRQSGHLAMAELFARAHRALLKTRGAVAAIARFDEERAEVEIAGIGNISVLLVRSGAQHATHPLVMPGVLGSAYRAVRPQVFPFGADDVLVMCTDGIRSRFDLQLACALPVQAAAQSIVHSCAKGSDDAACAIARGVQAAPTPEGSTEEVVEDRDVPIRIVGDAECAALEAKGFTLRAGFGTRAQWEVSIVASELATNVLKFAGTGELHLRHVRAPREAVVVEAVDRGRGIPDLPAALADGFSEGAPLNADRARHEGQGLGVGLGTVHRLMDLVTVESDFVRGTRIVAWKYLADRTETSSA